MRFLVREPQPLLNECNNAMDEGYYPYPCKGEVSDQSYCVYYDIQCFEKKLIGNNPNFKLETSPKPEPKIYG